MAPGTQVHLDGVTYGAGDVIDPSESEAQLWLLSGYVTVVQLAAKKAAKAK